MTTKPNVLFVLGAPGCGKGTQCKNIVEKFGFVHLSAGDLLRAEQSTPDSKYGDLIAQHIRDGLIVPVEITCKLINTAMENSKAENFLIDGFPRNKNNLDGWTAEMNDKANILGVLYIECSEEVCIQRCINRGEQGSGRTDDNILSLKKRFNTFHNDTMPIIEHFDSMDVVIKVSGENDPDKVFEEICNQWKKK